MGENLIDEDLMGKQWKQAIQTLLAQTNVAFLSTLSATGPESSMAPYAIFEGKVLLHLSQLARHTKNIQHTANMGLMICTPERQGISPLALPRLSLSGTVATVSSARAVNDKTVDDKAADAMACYLAAIPDALPLFDFADFTLYQLTIKQAFWVGGFGSARKIPLDTWLEITKPASTN